MATVLDITRDQIEDAIKKLPNDENRIHLSVNRRQLRLLMLGICFVDSCVGTIAHFVEGVVDVGG